MTGLPEMMNAEQSLINRGVGDVISQSFGATENTFPGFSQGNYSSLLNLRYAFKDALRHRVTVLGASGDAGATDYESDGATLYPYAGELLAVQRPAGHLDRRLAAVPGQRGQPSAARLGVERRRTAPVAAACPRSSPGRSYQIGVNTAWSAVTGAPRTSR